MLSRGQSHSPRVLTLWHTNNISVTGDLTSETLYWTSNLVDLREANNPFVSEAVRDFWLDLEVSVYADLPGNLAWG